MRLILISTLLSLSAITSPLFAPHQVQAQEVSAKIIGGTFAPEAAGGKIAYILTDQFSCSGTLVGQREVLTAAHCVAQGPGAAGTTVYVAGAWRTVESAWYHSRYDPSQSPAAMARYDLGMLILSEAIDSLSPIPVLRGKRITKGTKILIAGYGSNELSDDPSRSFSDNFKLGFSRVTEADGKQLFASHRAFRASACSGDSGGPAMVPFGKKSLALVGALSAGINLTDGGRCYLRGDGSFIEVDLQSPSSRSFLKYFQGVQYVRARSSR